MVLVSPFHYDGSDLRFFVVGGRIHVKRVVCILAAVMISMDIAEFIGDLQQLNRFDNWFRILFELYEAFTFLSTLGAVLLEEPTLLIPFICMLFTILIGLSFGPTLYLLAMVSSRVRENLYIESGERVKALVGIFIMYMLAYVVYLTVYWILLCYVYFDQRHLREQQRGGAAGASGQSGGLEMQRPATTTPPQQRRDLVTSFPNPLHMDEDVEARAVPANLPRLDEHWDDDEDNVYAR